MRLYFKPGACSLSSRITLNELGVHFEAIRVDTETGKTEAGADFQAINPKGYVPALEIAPGTVITENPAILQYLADNHPAFGLTPLAGTLERARLQEWLNFTSSELHKAFSPYFGRSPLEGAEKDRAEANLSRRIGDVARGLSDGRSFILGDAFSVADAYLFVVLNWTNFLGVNLERWPDIVRYVARVAARPAVQAALRAEGLIKDDAA
jgi:glutathione S-transferase